MPSLTTVISAGLAGLLAVPLLALTAPGGSPGCLPVAAINPSAAAPAIPGADAETGTTAAVDDLTWDSEQTGNAALIVAIGQARGVPAWGWVIAVATAMQESRLRNLPGGDRDSIGLFQQRPSASWGTPTQLRSPTYQAGKFYDTLLAIPGWQTMPLTQAAQRVQRSAFPNAYQHWARPATVLVARVAPQGSRAIPEDLGQFVSSGGCPVGGGDGARAGDGITLPPSFSFPPDTPAAVVTAVSWALAQLGTPYSYGGDCAAPHSGSAAHQCDCSSLVMAAYAHAGLRLPRTTSQQDRAGTPVASLSQIRSGDLIFIPGSDGTALAPGHVGLYVGDGLLVHAPHTGSTVSLARLEDWASSIVAIRRVA
jgi:hypothetical protein